MTNRQTLLLLVVLGPMACRSTKPEASTAATGSAASPTPSTVASTAAAHPRCLATFTQTRPASGWVEAGNVLITMKAGRATEMRILDTKGQLVTSSPLAAPGDLYAVVACKMNGYLGIPEGDPPSDGTLRMTVLRPIAESEPGDLALLCRKPDPMPTREDGSPIAWRLVTEVFEEQLTSKQWRTWMLELDEQLIPPTAATPRAKRTKADELDAAAKKAGMTSCWTADVLRL